MGAYIVGSIGALLGLVGVVITVRSNRRLVAQQAGDLQDKRIIGLHAELAHEQELRLDLEREVARLERRVDKLEEQVRSLGAVPVNGD